MILNFGVLTTHSPSEARPRRRWPAMTTNSASHPHALEIGAPSVVLPVAVAGRLGAGGTADLGRLRLRLICRTGPIGRSRLELLARVTHEQNVASFLESSSGQMGHLIGHHIEIVTGGHHIESDRPGTTAPGSALVVEPRRHLHPASVKRTLCLMYHLPEMLRSS